MCIFLGENELGQRDNLELRPGHVPAFTLEDWDNLPAQREAENKKQLRQV